MHDILLILNHHPLIKASISISAAICCYSQIADLFAFLSANIMKTFVATIVSIVVLFGSTSSAFAPRNTCALGVRKLAPVVVPTTSFANIRGGGNNQPKGIQNQRSSTASVQTMGLFGIGEPLGTYLMPIYAIGSWYGLIAQGQTGQYILPVAFVGWVWAGINILKSKRLDLGVVSFFFAMVSALCENQWGFTPGVKLALTISSAMVAANYSLVVLFWGNLKKGLAKSGTKSGLWFKVFWTYCAAMTVFWAVTAAKTYMR